MSGYTLCSTPERPVAGADQEAMDTQYDEFRTDTWVDISALPPCEECLRVAELLADPDMAPSLHRSRHFDSKSTGQGIRDLLHTDIVTGATRDRQAAVHLLTFTTVPDQPGFGDLVEEIDLVWGEAGIVSMGQVRDWGAVVDFAAAADVPDRDRQMIGVAAGLAGGPPVGLEAAVNLVKDPEATQRVIEAIVIAAGHGDRWELTEKQTPSART
ncbi:hypothetical protein ABT008_20520 [Micromonospora sp. NPDC002389]|uniref:hypothetical protein n=1 Tax=Micromonospora sp. NPDC002389 TaxID=3154272 RepID=UPI0033264072